MFLVMGITGRVGGATAEHLLAHGEEVRAGPQSRESPPPLSKAAIAGPSS